MKKKLLYCVSVLTLLTACSNEESDLAEAKMMNSLETKASAYNGNNPNEGGLQRQKNNSVKLTENLKLIKNGELKFQVKDLAKASAKIRELALQFDGYVSKDYTTDNDHSAYSMLEIRLPNENFDAFMNYAEKNAIGDVDRKVDVKDVTKEFVDYELRLTAAKKAQNRYLELLNKANKVEDMLQVEEKLQEVLAEIERIEGQLRYYQDKVSLSTIQIEMRTEEVEVVDEVEDGFWFDMKNAVKRGWNLILGLIVAITNLWVFIPVIFFGFWWYRKRKIKRSGGQ